MSGNGGPAFPVTKQIQEDGGVVYFESDAGMSIRDHFAGLACLAELQSAGSFQGPAESLRIAATRAGCTIEQQIARNSYRMADAMLAERAKETK